MTEKQYYVSVERRVVLAIKAGGPAVAIDAACAEAWQWQPESAAFGKQGQVTARLSGGVVRAEQAGPVHGPGPAKAPAPVLGEQWMPRDG